MLQMWRDGAEIAVGAYPYLSFLWLHCRPRYQRCSEYSHTCKAGARPSGANVHRWVPRFLRSPCVYAWGVVTFPVPGREPFISFPLTGWRSDVLQVVFVRSLALAAESGGAMADLWSEVKSHERTNQNRAR